MGKNMSNPIGPAVYGATCSQNPGPSTSKDDNATVIDSTHSNKASHTPFVVHRTTAIPRPDSQGSTQPPLSDRSIQRRSGIAVEEAQPAEDLLLRLASETKGIGKGRCSSDFLCNMKLMISLLANEVTNVNHADSDGWSALHHAVSNDNEQLVAVLMTNFNADANRQNNEGIRAIDLAQPDSNIYRWLSGQLSFDVKQTARYG